jgi:hypothetical protein
MNRLLTTYMLDITCHYVAVGSRPVSSRSVGLADPQQCTSTIRRVQAEASAR